MSEQYDRQLIDEDFKQRVADIGGLNLSLPAPDIYDEPVRYYKANLQWTGIIESMVDWLADVAPWQDATNEDYSGIRQVIRYIKGIEIPTCQLFGMQSNFISYSPNNPYTEPNTIPPGYAETPFNVYDGGGSQPPDYQAGDIFVPFTAINLNPFDLFTGNLPQIQIGIRGAAEVEFKFLQYPLGGAVVVSVNNPPDIGDIIGGIVGGNGVNIIDLELDITAIPPETDILLESDLTITQEENEESIIYLTFIPVLDDSLIPLRYGGGIRAIEICGSAEVYNPITNENYNPNQYQEGLIVTTYEELCAAVSCGMLDVFARALNGSSGNTLSQITLDENGLPVITGSASGGALSTDARRNRMALCEIIESRLEEYIVDYNDFYLGSSPEQLQIMETFLTSKYMMTANVTQAVANYNDHILATNPAPNPNLDGLDRIFYCEGIIKQKVSAWIIDDLQADKVLRLSMIDALSQDQLDSWFAEGTNTISDDYINSACFIFEPFTITVDAQDFIDKGNNLAFDTASLVKPNRIYNVKISGQFTNGTIIFDGMFNKTGAVIQYAPLRFADSNGNAGTVPKTQPTYKLGEYNVIYETTGNITLAWTRSSNVGWTGTITLLMIDTGSRI
ncbi:MAG: hypothetical protein WBC91_26500 [Phototrophicaceae bacterium]